jgi:glycosyltransferase involved in cell wall biosynthesis
MSKPVVLVLNRYYLPGFKAGGPITSLRNLFNLLGSEFNFKLITFDRDLGDNKPYKGIQTGSWYEIEKINVYYIKKNFLSIFRIASVTSSTRYDVLYLNGFFSFETTLFPLFLSKLMCKDRSNIIIAPRGVFSPAALSLKSKKKHLALAFCKMFRLHKGIIWQASSEFEERDIRRVIGQSAEVHVAVDLPGSSTVSTADYLGGSGILNIVFVARVAPIKNLEFVLQTLAFCKENISFKIYGPIEDREYWKHCEKLIIVMPDNISVKYCGIVPPLEVQGVLAQNDLMFLPTKGENFGHVIAESLCAGTPVLISDTTPWKSFPTDVGMVLPLDSQLEYAKHIDQLAGYSTDQMAMVRKSVLSFANAMLQNSEDKKANRFLFNFALQRRSRIVNGN